MQDMTRIYLFGYAVLMIVGGVMGGAENTVVLVTRGGETPWPKMPKDDVARRLVAHIAGMMA